MAMYLFCPIWISTTETELLKVSYADGVIVLVSQSWKMLVHSQTIFKQILTSIKDVSAEMQRAPQRKKKAIALPTDKLQSSR